MNSPEAAKAAIAYQTLCSSYNAIDGFRGTLLGFLPLATGGVFLLAGQSGQVLLSDPQFSIPIGLFGFFITLGLFIFEVYGIRRCTHLIILGRHLERQMKTEGQFLHRPSGLKGLGTASFWRLINEPMASGVIYPAVGAAWLYLGLSSLNLLLASGLALLIFTLGFHVTYRYNQWLIAEDWPATEKKLKTLGETDMASPA